MTTTAEWNYDKFRKTQKSFASTDGYIKYIDEGEGPVICLLHGIPCSSWLYRKLIPKLTAKGYRVIAPDMLGYGNSDNPKSYELYSAEEHGKRLLELMDHLEIKTWNHAQHDVGGMWTWEMLKIDDSRISNLIILNSIILQDGFQPPVKMKPGAIAKITMWMYKNGVTTNFMMSQLFRVGLENTKLTKAEKEGYKKPLLEKKTNGMYYFFSNTSKDLPNYEDLLESLDIPTCVIWGKHDDMLVWEPQSNRVKELLKIEDQHVHILDASHFVQEERPQEISEIMLNFIESE